MLERSQKFLLEYVNKSYIFNSLASFFNLKQKLYIQKTCRHWQMFSFYVFMFLKRKPLWEIVIQTTFSFLSEITFCST